MVMSPLQMMLLFLEFPKNHFHAILQREFGPLPHPFLPLTASELTSVYSWVCKYRFMSNQSRHSTPNVARIILVPVFSSRVWLRCRCVVFDSGHLFIIFPGCRSFSFCTLHLLHTENLPVLVATICLIWDLVSLAVITGAVFHFLMKYYISVRAVCLGTSLSAPAV